MCLMDVCRRAKGRQVTNEEEVTVTRENEKGIRQCYDGDEGHLLTLALEHYCLAYASRNLQRSLYWYFRKCPRIVSMLIHMRVCNWV